MLGRREVSSGFGEQDQAWLSCREVVALVVFLTLFACLVVWTTTAMPGPVAEVNVELLLPALASSSVANARPVNYVEEP
jgi:hypothetical protein